MRWQGWWQRSCQEEEEVIKTMVATIVEAPTMVEEGNNTTEGIRTGAEVITTATKEDQVDFRVTVIIVVQLATERLNVGGQRNRILYL